MLGRPDVVKSDVSRVARGPDQAVDMRRDSEQSTFVVVWHEIDWKRYVRQDATGCEVDRTKGSGAPGLSSSALIAVFAWNGADGLRSQRACCCERNGGEESSWVGSEVVDNDDADGTNGGGYPGEMSDVALRERELQLRQRELELKEQEMRMRRGGYGGPGPRRRAPPTRNGAGMYDDEDEEDDYFDSNSGPVVPMINPDNFDMMSVTSRKNRSKPPPNQSDVRANHLNGRENGMPSRGGRFRPNFGRNRSSQIVNSIPSLHENILDDPMMGYSSNRYGNVDRGQIHAGSRSNSLTASHLQELQNGPGMNGAYPRRVSQSPGNPYTPSMRGGNGRPSPPNGMQQPVPQYPPGHGNTVAPQQVEQRVGVSTPQPPNMKPVRSLTGSASASAGSGDSTNLGSEPSAHSSQSSLGPRPPLGTR
ncbi:hypothetical protein NUW58_g3030 [Xylaria curta]|uniref:Uncharacterized protein n=1 Tax=Xylaria curta TaxID=42375 RepID=A0ACC1PEF3_9PEZI|nr:hypothetical protein NUW58_g3030 [Xylaria curta]